MKQNRIITAGKELLKLNVGNAFKSLIEQSQYSADLDPAAYRGQEEIMFFFSADGIEYKFDYTDRNSAVRAYQKCPPIAAIINRKAQAYINGKTWVLNSKGKEAQGPEAVKLRRLLTTPNPMQSWRQFDAQTYIYQQLFGFAIWLPIIPTGFRKLGPIEAEHLWNIPPFMVEIEESKELYYRAGGKLIKRIVLKYGNQRTEIDPETVIILKDFSPSFNSVVIPDSRLQTLRMNINNIIGALESENVIIDRRGPDYMISSDAKDGSGYIPLRPDEKTEIENKFQKQYGLRKSQSRVIVTSAAAKISTLSFNMRELMLHESVKENTKTICDVLNYPPHLLGLIDPTYNNQNAAEKGLYNNAIIPEANSNTEQLNQIFKTEERNLFISKDYSHIPVLQEDRRAENMARKTLDEALAIEYSKGLITLNDWLVELGKDPIGELGNVRATDPNSNVPLAISLGVGGVQSLISVVTAQASAEAKASILEIVFGIQPKDAARMVVETANQNSNNGNQQQQQQEQEPGETES
jgi:hypothetical protein